MRSRVLRSLCVTATLALVVPAPLPAQPPPTAVEVASIQGRVIARDASLWTWSWSLRLRNYGRTPARVDARIEFVGDDASVDDVKVCGVDVPANGVRVVTGEHSIRASVAGTVRSVTARVDPNARWC